MELQTTQLDVASHYYLPKKFGHLGEKMETGRKALFLTKMKKLIDSKKCNTYVIISYLWLKVQFSKFKEIDICLTTKEI